MKPFVSLAALLLLVSSLASCDDEQKQDVFDSSEQSELSELPDELDESTPEQTEELEQSEELDETDEQEQPPVLVPQCPENIPDTGDLEGLHITRESFGCYGACGPACESECDEGREFVYEVQGDGQCSLCTYVVSACKSHDFCRWHDDCYRQCDHRWAALHEEEPENAPNNPCYRNCDLPVLTATVGCGADWAQLDAGEPQIDPECWDGSFVVYSKLLSSDVVAGACTASTESSPRPFFGQVDLWDDESVPPEAMPQGYSCSNDEDCPDRNQYCELDTTEPGGINGPGRCYDIEPSPGVDLSPLETAGLRSGTDWLPDGEPCVFGFDCQGGHCVDGNCAQTP
jgi:hypothetical protein